MKRKKKEKEEREKKKEEKEIYFRKKRKYRWFIFMVRVVRKQSVKNKIRRKVYGYYLLWGL